MVARYSPFSVVLCFYPPSVFADYFVTAWVERIQHSGCDDTFNRAEYDTRLWLHDDVSLNDEYDCVTSKGDSTDHKGRWVRKGPSLNAKSLTLSWESEEDDDNQCRRDRSDDCKAGKSCRISMPFTSHDSGGTERCADGKHIVWVKWAFSSPAPTASPTWTPSSSPPTAAPSPFQCATWFEYPCWPGYARKYTGTCQPGGGGQSGGSQTCGYEKPTDAGNPVGCVDCERDCCEPVSCVDEARPGTAQAHADYTNCWGIASSTPCKYTCAPGWSPTAAGLAHSVQCNVVQASLGSAKRSLYDFTNLDCEPHECTDAAPGTVARGVDYGDCLSGKTSGQSCRVGCMGGWKLRSGPTGDVNLNLVCDRASCPSPPGHCRGVFDASVPIWCEPYSCDQGPRSGTFDPTEWPPGAAYRVDYAHCSQLSTGQTCVPSCPVGHTLDPAAGFELYCGATGYDAQYNGGSGVRCKPNDCSAGPTSLTYDPNIADRAKIAAGMSVPTDAAIAAAAATDGYSPCSQSTTGNNCVPRCKDGWYSSPNSFDLTCVAGRYNATAECKPYTCSQPTGLSENISIADFSACSNLTSGQLCVPPCLPGYRQLGVLSLVCDDKGEYPAPRTTVNCTPYKCSMGPNGTSTDRNASYEGCNAQETGDTCQPSCDPPGQEGGRTLMGAAGPDSGFVLACYPNVTYAAPYAYCYEHRCVQGPSSGLDKDADYTSCTRMRTGQHCSPECAPGYSLNGSFALVCLRDETFAAGAGTCDPNKCVGGPDPAGGQGIDSRANYGACDRSVTDDTCKPVCDEGFYLSDPQGFTLLCSDKNRTYGPKLGFTVETTLPFQYTSTDIRCEGHFCNMGRSNHSDTHIDPNHDCDRMQSGQDCFARCTKGYSLQPPGAIEMVCDASNMFNFWAMGQKSCVANRCGHCILNTTQFFADQPSAKGDPQYVNLTECRGADPNGNYSECYNRTTDQQCSASCKPGFRPYPESFTLNCDEHGRYEAFGQTCDQMFCRPSCAVLHNRCHRCNYSMSAGAVNTAAQDNVMCGQIRTFDAASYMFGRPLVLAKLGCDTMYWDSENETATEWMLCPTALTVSIGSPHLKHIRGCIVGNAVFCIVSALAVTVGLAVLGARRAGRGVGKRVVTTVIEKFRPARMISLMTLPHSFVASGTAYCAMQLYWRSPLTQDRIIAGIGAVLLVVHPVLLLLLVLRPGKFHAQPAVFPDADKHPIRAFFAGKQEWRATDREPDFVHVHGFSFVWWRPGFHAWMLAESAQSIVVGGASGWATNTPEACNWRNLVLICCLGTYAVALLIARPARSMLANGMFITTAASLCLAILFMYLGFRTFQDVSELVGRDVKDASIGGTIDCTIFTKQEEEDAKDYGAYDARYYDTAQWFLSTAAFVQVLKGLSDFTAQVFDTMTVSEIARIEREAADARARAEQAQRDFMAEMFSGGGGRNGGPATFLREIDDLDDDLSDLTDARRRWRLLRRAVLFGDGVTGVLDRGEVQHGKARVGRFNLSGTDVKLPVWRQKANRLLGQSDTTFSDAGLRKGGGKGNVLLTSQGDAPLRLDVPSGELDSPLESTPRTPSGRRTPRPQQKARVLGDVERLRQLWLEDAGRAGRNGFDRSLKHLAGATATVLERQLEPLGNKGLGVLLEFPTGEKGWWPARCLEHFSSGSVAGSTPEQEEHMRRAPSAAAAVVERPKVVPGSRVRVRRDAALVRQKWTEGGGLGAAHYFEGHLLARVGAEGTASRVDSGGSAQGCSTVLVRFADGHEDWWPVGCLELVGEAEVSLRAQRRPTPVQPAQLPRPSLGPSETSAPPLPPPPAPGSRMRVPADAGRVRAAWAAAGGEMGVRYFMQRLSRTLGRSGEVVQTRSSKQEGRAEECAVLMRIGNSEDWWPLSSLVPYSEAERGVTSAAAEAGSQQALVTRRDIATRRAEWLARGKLEGAAAAARPAAAAASSMSQTAGSPRPVQRLTSRSSQLASTMRSRSEADADCYLEPLLDRSVRDQNREAAVLDSGWSPLLPPTVAQVPGAPRPGSELGPTRGKGTAVLSAPPPQRPSSPSPLLAPTSAKASFGARAARAATPLCSLKGKNHPGLRSGPLTPRRAAGGMQSPSPRRFERLKGDIL